MEIIVCQGEGYNFMWRSWWIAVFVLHLACAEGVFAAGTVARDGVWAQDYLELAADPAVHFGRLPNGLRYAVMHSATPVDQVSVRLLIRSGSLAESDAQQGLAHFIEHMAFRGSTHVADGEMARALQRRGLLLGADTNAFTKQESTDYRFDLPSNDIETIATSLGFLREIATELTFSAQSVDAERGVVLAEERQRDNAELHALKDELGFLLGGRLASQRWPIGQTKVITSVTPEELRSFYLATYRPANATVVIVGDIDVGKMEALIKEKFSDWTPGTDDRQLKFGAPTARGFEAHLFAEAGLSHAVEISWVRPFDDTADTIAHRRQLLIDFIATQIFNERLRASALTPDPPFFSAQMSRANLVHSANITTLIFNGPFNKWPTGLAALLGQQRRMIRDGITPTELSRVIAQLTAALTSSLAGSSTRATPALADGLMSAALENRVFISPTQALNDFQNSESSITAEEINAAFSRSFNGTGPLLFLKSAVTIDSGEAKLRDAFVAASQAPIGVADAVTNTAWPYDHLGHAGKVVARQAIAGLGVTAVRFANGVDLLVKPTDFAQDGVEVDIRFGTGRLGFPLDQAHAFWSVNGIVPLFVSSGTGRLAVTDLQRLLGDRVVGVNFATNDTSFDLQGHTRPHDFDTELQLLAGYIVDPGFRPDAFVRLKDALAATLLQADSEPATVLMRNVPRRLHNDDPRWSTIRTGSTSAQRLAPTFAACSRPTCRLDRSVSL